MTTPADPEAIDRFVKAFESAWLKGESPQIGDFLPADLSAASRLEFLKELICVDLEFCWKEGSARGVHDYLTQFPELGTVEDVPIELIGEEYRVRQQYGVAPSRQIFLSEFPGRREEIETQLSQIDRELHEERSVEDWPVVSPVLAFDGRPDPAAPLLYSDFRLQKLLGAGLMGRVYRAWQQSLDRPVAVKYLRKAFHNDPKAVARFLSEARTVGKLRHENIVGIHGLGRSPQGGYFLVMDWIDGPDLAAVLHERHGVDFERAVRWTRDAAVGIAKAHELGVIHCDLKPANLLLDSGGIIRVTDFGMSRSMADETRTGDRIEGTAPFMAPEQVSRHWGTIDVRTDVYGLGAVLYTLIKGVPPCQGRTIPDVLSQVISAVPISPLNANEPLVLESLDQICRKCLAKCPEDRFASVTDLIRELDEFLRESG